MWQRAVSAETIIYEKHIVCSAGIGVPNCRMQVSGARWSCALFGRAHRRRAHKAGTLHRNGLPSNGSASRPTCRLRELHCLLHTHFAVRRCAICTKCVRRGNSSGIFRAEISATVVAEHVWRAALYTLNVELHDKDSQVLDDWHKQIGLRELTISRNQDEWGEEFCFRVNGVKIFAMGADYIPRTV